SINKNNVTANKDFGQAANGISPLNKIGGRGRHNIRKENTGVRRPGSSQDATDNDNFGEGGNTSLSRTNDQYHAQNKELTLLPQASQGFFESPREIANYPVDKIIIQKGPATSAKTQKNKANHSNGAFEWGVLIGANPN